MASKLERGSATGKEAGNIYHQRRCSNLEVVPILPSKATKRSARAMKKRNRGVRGGQEARNRNHPRSQMSTQSHDIHSTDHPQHAHGSDDSSEQHSDSTHITPSIFRGTDLTPPGPQTTNDERSDQDSDSPHITPSIFRGGDLITPGSQTGGRRHTSSPPALPVVFAQTSSIPVDDRTRQDWLPVHDTAAYNTRIISILPTLLTLGYEVDPPYYANWYNQPIIPLWQIYIEPPDRIQQLANLIHTELDRLQVFLIDSKAAGMDDDDEMRKWRESVVERLGGDVRKRLGTFVKRVDGIVKRAGK
ncbi:hypothetical protein LTR86_008093 [Recurvomyces mirabilis]|nr:hypothetical protein LTR86_008093 [Recurvomyces mirabilis]